MNPTTLPNDLQVKFNQRLTMLASNLPQSDPTQVSEKVRKLATKLTNQEYPEAAIDLIDRARTQLTQPNAFQDEELHALKASTQSTLVDRLVQRVDTAPTPEGISILEAAKLCNPNWASSHTLTGHPEAIWSIAALANDRLASGDQGGLIHVWDLKTGRKLFELTGHTKWVRALIKWNDNELISGSHDETIIRWDIERKVALRTFKLHSGHIEAITKLPGKLLASTSTKHEVVISDPESGSHDRTIKIWKRTWDQQSIELLNKLHTLYHNNNQPDKARKILSELVHVYREQNQWDKIVQTLTTHYPQSTDSLVLRSLREAQEKRNNFDAAIDASIKLAQVRPKDPSHLAKAAALNQQRARNFEIEQQRLQTTLAQLLQTVRDLATTNTQQHMSLSDKISAIETRVNTLESAQNQY